MVLAISLIKAVPEREKAVYRALKEMDSVKSLYQIFGDHDILVIIEADSKNEIRKILNDVEELGYVNSVKSMLIAPANKQEFSTCTMKNALRTSPG